MPHDPLGKPVPAYNNMHLPFNDAGAHQSPDSLGDGFPIPVSHWGRVTGLWSKFWGGWGNIPQHGKQSSRMWNEAVIGNSCKPSVTIAILSGGISSLHLVGVMAYDL